MDDPHGRLGWLCKRPALVQPSCGLEQHQAPRHGDVAVVGPGWGELDLPAGYGGHDGAVEKVLAAPEDCAKNVGRIECEEPHVRDLAERRDLPDRPEQDVVIVVVVSLSCDSVIFSRGLPLTPGPVVDQKLSLAGWGDGYRQDGA